MPDQLPNTSLDQLLETRSDLWRGRRMPHGQVISSGHAQLDQWLPGQGWPCGRLTELLTSQGACGELALLSPMLARQTMRQQPVLLANPPLVPCPQFLRQAGVELDQLVIIRSARQALWAAEQALHSGLCGAVVVWHPSGRVEPRTIRRLALAAQQGKAPLLVCYRPSQSPPPALAELRLAIHPGPELVLLRGGPRRRLQLGKSNVITLPDSVRDPQRTRGHSIRRGQTETMARPIHSAKPGNRPALSLIPLASAKRLAPHG